jgi:hypothetical protein
MRCAHSYDGTESYPTLWDKAAALLWALATTQGFIDGNKRTARTAMETFLAQPSSTSRWWSGSSNTGVRRENLQPTVDGMRVFGGVARKTGLPGEGDYFREVGEF